MLRKLIAKLRGKSEPARPVAPAPSVPAKAPHRDAGRGHAPRPPQQQQHQHSPRPPQGRKPGPGPGPARSQDPIPRAARSGVRRGAARVAVIPIRAAAASAAPARRATISSIPGARQSSLPFRSMCRRWTRPSRNWASPTRWPSPCRKWATSSPPPSRPRPFRSSWRAAMSSVRPRRARARRPPSPFRSSSGSGRMGTCAA